MRKTIAILFGMTLLILVTVTNLFWTSAAPPERDGKTNSGRLLVLGIDGMDPKLLKELIEAGEMPHFARLAQQGDFKPLETSVPPQSPVAWSNIISGSDPGTHEIYDFIHRDPNPGPAGLAVRPYLSTSRVLPSDGETEGEQADSWGQWARTWGQWKIPLAGGATQLLRQGPTYWEELAAHGINTAVYRIPANYPAQEVAGPGQCVCLCGMGTPDLLGTYGLFTLFTPEAPPEGRDVPGGRLEHWQAGSDRVTGTLVGPENFLRRPDQSHQRPSMTIDFNVTRDAQADVAKIEIQEHLLLLNETEWSDWIPLNFQTGLPGSTVLSALGSPTSMPCMVRFYLKQVHPTLEVYVSPLNIDPQNPVNAISSPPEFAQELAESMGRFYTTGIPQDTKALRQHVISEEEFLVQSRSVLSERIDQFRHALENFDDGCLFYYFGSVDQLSHMFWRDRDSLHPGRLPEQAGKFERVIDDCYVRMDGLLGEALDTLGENDTILVISDHGFTSFRRGFNLNSWLVENDYITLFDRLGQDEYEMFSNVDWPRTQAYALGLNGLYVNLRGREKNGVVEKNSQYDALLSEISERLLEVRDQDGSQVIETVYRVDELYPDADRDIAPDLLIGYAAGYRASWATALGGMPRELLEDNLDRWSGDHCVAHHIVPGVVLSNRKLNVDDPSLSDIGPTILDIFGIAPPKAMTGRPIIQTVSKPGE